MTYLESCTKYFAPLDEIQEALDNNEGLCGLSSVELKSLVNSNKELKTDLIVFSN